MMNVVKCEDPENYIVELDRSKLYIDHTNSRLKILECKSDSPSLPADIIEYASHLNLGKIIYNCPEKYLTQFRNSNYIVEGRINGYYRGEDAYCISYFATKKRSISNNNSDENRILNLCTSTYTQYIPNNIRSLTIRNAHHGDIPEMIKLFREVFKTYPSPVFNANYLQNVMKDQILFKVGVIDNKIVSIASADMDKDNLNAEMTDCATHPEYTGRGILSNLLFSLECDLKEKGFYTLYSLSRAINPGINMVLCKQDYIYYGRLVNNCNICGGFEDMNIWVKNLRKQQYRITREQRGGSVASEIEATEPPLYSLR